MLAGFARQLPAGVMLIDRNDELAALHEKAHTQEALIAAGTMELSIREDEVRATGWVAGYWLPQGVAVPALLAEDAERSDGAPQRGGRWSCFCNAPNPANSTTQDTCVQLALSHLLFLCLLPCRSCVC